MFYNWLIVQLKCPPSLKLRRAAFAPRNGASKTPLFDFFPKLACQLEALAACALKLTSAASAKAGGEGGYSKSHVGRTPRAPAKGPSPQGAFCTMLSQGLRP